MFENLEKWLAENNLKNHCPLFDCLMRGIEKENLRVTQDGQLSHTPHPKSLGKALTHPVITTDFSENLTEIMTPPLRGRRNLFTSLENISAYAWHHLSGDPLLINHPEYFWPMSMPVGIGYEDDIPIANYGRSHIGQFKSLYREGLAQRYGKKMQIIAGIHYNFSFPDIFFHGLFSAQTKSDIYFVLLRNFYKNYWILPYLFGASPACDQSFLQGKANNFLDKFSDHSLIGEYATSLRMSDIGYQNSAQGEICISLNSAQEYSKTLGQAVDKIHEPYTELNQNLQLNNHLLQIENEYYSPIRPKQLVESGERPTQALCRRGVRYMEIRVLDLNPFTPLGLTPSESAFLDVFLTYCALGSQDLISKEDLLNYKNNFKQVVSYGRDPQCELILNNKNLNHKNKQTINLKDAAYELINQLLPLARIMDSGSSLNNQDFEEAVLLEQAKIQDVNKTPSQQILNLMRERNLSHSEFGLIQAEAHQAYFEEIVLSECLAKQMDAMTVQSIKDEQAEVLLSQGSFEDYLKSYFDAPRGCES